MTKNLTEIRLRNYINKMHIFESLFLQKGLFNFYNKISLENSPYKKRSALSIEFRKFHSPKFNDTLQKK